MSTSNPGETDWMLDDLADRLVGVRYAVVHSTDGLVLGRTSTMTREDAEHFAAVSSTLYGLSRSAGSRFDGGGVRQAVIELERAILFVAAAGQNACLALQVEQSANFGIIAYDMNRTVRRIGRAPTGHAVEFGMASAVEIGPFHETRLTRSPLSQRLNKPHCP